MKIFVTGSAGHLGEALVRTLQETDHEVIGADLVPSPFTDRVGSITDREQVKGWLAGVDAVLHTATLHKPHVATHSRQAFVDTNITGTLNLLEEAVLAGVRSFVFTSTTSAFGDALTPPPGAPAAWITEEMTPAPKNIYGVTKRAAEDLCELFHRNQRLACLVLRTSRFFPEADDNPETRQGYADANVKANEFLYRRVDIADVVSAHLLTLEKNPATGLSCLIIIAPTPLSPRKGHTPKSPLTSPPPPPPPPLSQSKCPPPPPAPSRPSPTLPPPSTSPIAPPPRSPTPSSPSSTSSAPTAPPPAPPTVSTGAPNSKATPSSPASICS